MNLKKEGEGHYQIVIDEFDKIKKGFEQKKQLPYWTYSIIISQSITAICYLVAMFIRAELIIPYKFILDYPFMDYGQRAGLLVLLLSYSLGSFCGGKFIESKKENVNYIMGLFISYFISLCAMLSIVCKNC